MAKNSEILETAHKVGSEGLGRVALMLATQKLSRKDLEQTMCDLREAARLIEVVIHQ